LKVAFTLICATEKSAYALRVGVESQATATLSFFASEQDINEKNTNKLSDIFPKVQREEVLVGAYLEFFLLCWRVDMLQQLTHKNTRQHTFFSLCQDKKTGLLADRKVKMITSHNITFTTRRSWC